MQLRVIGKTDSDLMAPVNFGTFNTLKEACKCLQEMASDIGVEMPSGLRLMSVSIAVVEY